MSEIKLTADSGGGTVSLKGPATTTGNAAVPFVLPVADGSAGQFLKTDGSKNLSFATGGGDNTPSFNVRNSADQVVSHNTHTQVTLDTEDWDTDNAFASNTFTVPSGKGGKYQFHFNMAYGLTDQKEGWGYLSVNDTQNRFSEVIFTASVTGQTVTCQGSCVLNLSAGDTVKLYTYHYNGANATLNDIFTYFNGYRLIGI